MDGSSQSFDDVLSRVGQIAGGFQKIPGPPGTSSEQGEIKKEMGSQSKLLGDIESFKTPQVPKFEPLPKPIEEQYSNPLDAFKSVIPVFSIFASLATRHPLKTAMTSMAASMDAYHKGETEKFEQERKNSKDAMDYALAQNKQNMDVYNAILSKENMDVAQKEALIKGHAEMAQDWRVIAGLKNDGYKGAVDAIMANNEIYNKALTISEKIYKDQQSVGGKFNFSGLSQNELVPGTGLTLASIQQKVEALHNGASYQDAGLSMRTTKNPQKDAVDQLRAEMYPDDDIAASKLEYGEKKREESSIATRTAPAKIAVKEMDNLAEPMVSAVKKLDPSKYPDLNSIENAYQKKTGDANVIKAVIAVQEFKTAAVNLLVRNGVPTDQARSKVDELAGANFALDQIEAVRDQFKITSGAVIDALQQAKNDISGKTGEKVDLHDKYGLER